ncbi:hypothetical protein J3D55_001643 [Chryseobacterium ginsenosidimutans]|nr:hypothetical protein [Chryseobacterium ginsenosidimutans]
MNWLRKTDTAYKLLEILLVTENFEVTNFLYLKRDVIKNYNHEFL